MKEQARELYEFLTKHGIDACHLVGHSMGGAIAIECALTYPKKVCTLTLVSTFAKLELKEKLLAYLNRLVLMSKIPKSLINSFNQSRLFSENASSFVRQFNQDIGNRVDTATVLSQLKACLSFDRLHDLSSINIPTKVIVGEQDALLPSSYCKKIAGLIKGATLITIPFVGHIPPLEAPKHFAKEVIWQNGF